MKYLKITVNLLLQLSRYILTLGPLQNIMILMKEPWFNKDSINMFNIKSVRNYVTSKTAYYKLKKPNQIRIWHWHFYS